MKVEFDEPTRHFPVTITRTLCRTNPGLGLRQHFTTTLCNKLLFSVAKSKILLVGLLDFIGIKDFVSFSGAAFGS